MDYRSEDVQAVVTPRDWRRIVESAREKHDTDFGINNPKPKPQERQRSGAERFLDFTKYIWLILALAGAIISFPHTWEIVENTVDLSGYWANLYAAAVFIGLELAILGVSFVMTLNNEISERQERKQWSIVGTINALIRRVGFDFQFEVDHIPAAHQTAAQQLIFFLLGIQLIFNLSDTISTVPIVSDYYHIIELIVNIAVGVLAPILLWVAGHRTAEEVAAAVNRSRQVEDAIDEWKIEREISWSESRDDYVVTEASRYKTVTRALGRNVPGTGTGTLAGTPAMAQERGFGFANVRSQHQPQIVPNRPQPQERQHSGGGTLTHDEMIAQMLDNPEMKDWSHQRLADHFGIAKGRATTNLKSDPRL